MPLAPGFTLQPHQQRLADSAAAAQAAGQPFRTLAYWGLGSGKSLGALNVADTIGGTASAVVPAALRPNLKGEAHKFFGRTDIPVSSYQAAATGRAPQTNTLLIDEAQRLGSPSSTQARAVTDMAAGARNVVLMSGTPVRNRPNEFAPLMSILTGAPVTPEQFDKRYVGTETLRPGLLGRLRGVAPVTRPALVNTDELKRLLQGHVDYYENETPTVDVKHEVHEADMTPRQAELYSGMFGRLPLVMRWKMRWNYPLSDDELVRARSFLTGPRQVSLSDLPYRSDGDPHRAFLNSGKLTKAFGLLKEKLDADPRHKAIVYSNFPEAGLRPYAAALAKAGIPHGTFDGTLSDTERKALVDGFTHGRLRVALVGPAGAEGISLKGAQVLQVLDGSWQDARTRQAIGRGLRYDSHANLPDELKHLTVQKFVAKLPLGVRDRLLESVGFDRSGQRLAVDDYMGNLADKKEVLNRQLLALLKEVGTQNRTKVAEDLGYVLTGHEVLRLADIGAEVFGAVKAAALFSAPEFLAASEARREKHYLGRYTCPHCGGTNMFNGIPGTGTSFRGSGMCQDCKRGCSIVGLKLKPIGTGPEIVPTAEQLADLERRKAREERLKARDEGTKEARQPDAPMEAAGWICETCQAWTREDPPANKCPKCSGDPEPVIGRLQTIRDNWDKDCPQLYVNPKTKEIWIETGDWHETDEVKRWYKDVQKRFKAWTVKGESESRPPEKDGWLKAAAYDPRLAQVKAFSDLGTREGYDAKARLIRDLIREDPAAWHIDSDAGGHVVGLTHTSGWRYHVPRAALVGLDVRRTSVLPGFVPGTGAQARYTDIT